MRSLLAKSNIFPEDLPPEEDIKKLERRIHKENEKLIDGIKALLEVLK